MPKTFRTLSGVHAQGDHYEEINIANLLLKLVNDDSIKNFALSSNNADFHGFDDIVCETFGANETKYALQLKHLDNKVTLAPESLTSETGKFSVKKYFQCFKNNRQHLSPYKLILFTNKMFKVPNGQRINFPQGFSAEISEIHADPLLNTKPRGSCYQFVKVQVTDTSLGPELDDYVEFFEKFYLYPNQTSLSPLKQQLERRFQNQFDCSNVEFDNYCKFVSNWCSTTGEKEVLEKRVVKRSIALCVLAPYVKPIVFGQVNDKMQVFREAAKDFDVTVVEKDSYRLVAKLWGDSKNGVTTQGINEVKKRYVLNFNPAEMSDVDFARTFWLMDVCPLIVSESKTTLEAIHMCKNEKFVLLGRSPELESCSIFQDLSNLNPDSDTFKTIMSTFKCSIQGKEDISLRTLIQDEREFLKDIRTSDLVEMIEGSYEIGGRKNRLPEPYIERSLSGSTIRLDFLKKVNHDILVVIDNYLNVPDSDILRSFNIIDVSDSFRQKDCDQTRTYATMENLVQVSDLVESNLALDLYISRTQLSNEDFRAICEENAVETCYHFRLTDDGNLEWIQNTRIDINSLKEFSLETSSIKETTLYAKSQDKINVIIGEPGMGKSVLMQNLKNSSAATCWTVIFHSEDIFLLSDFFRDWDVNVPNFEEFVLSWKYQKLKSFARRMLEMLMRERRIIYVWDALDEISTQNLEVLTTVILELAQEEASIYQWVTCRCHLKEYLENTLNTFSRRILQFSQEQQNYYIQQRLFTSTSQESDIIAKTDMVKRLIVHHDILGIPLQIFMLTELFLQDSQKYKDILAESAFNAIDLYKYFIDEKFEIYFKKQGACYLKTPQIRTDIVTSTIRNYQRAALKSLLLPYTPSEDFEAFLNKIEEDSDSVGIIIEITEQNTLHFIHKSFAEYFAAKYFEQHHGSIVNFEKILFDDTNRNIRFFFDLLLAQNSPPHIAVLYKSLDKLREHATSLATARDAQGRSVLHLACAWGQRYPTFRQQYTNGAYIIDNANEDKFTVAQEDQEYVDMLEYLLETCRLEEVDRLFRFTPMSYAEKTKSVYAKVAWLRRQNEDIELDDSVLTFFYYSSKFGYVNVLDMCRSFPFIKTKSDGATLLHHAVDHPDFVDRLLQVDPYRQQKNSVDAYGQTPLLRACQQNSDGVVLALIQNDNSINMASNIGRTPLHYACQYGHTNIVNLLIERGASVNTKDNKKWTPLHVAAYYGYPESVRSLIQADGEVDVFDHESRTPLHLSCLNGHNDVIQVLIHSTADLNAGSNWKPLHSASFSGHEEAVQLLVEHRADINAPTTNGRTALHYACEKGFSNIARFLCENGADVDIADTKDWTPLHLASKNGFHEIAQILTEAGADVNMVRDKEWTPTILACWKGYDRVLKYLIKTDVDANVTTMKGRTPLHYACHFGHDGAVKLLLEFSDIDVPDNTGMTALHHAACKGHANVTWLLLKAGASINARTNNGRTPLHYACQHGHDGVVDILLKFEADTNSSDREEVTPLHLACHNGHKNIVALLIRGGVNINAKNRKNWTPLHYASQTGHTKVVELLLENSPEMDLHVSTGGTPLHIASQNGHENIVLLLCKAGASINSTTERKTTPLHIACENNHFRVVWLLTDFKCELDSRDSDGWTPLHIACRKKNFEIIQHLINSGADLYAGFDDGWMPLHLMCSLGFTEVCLILLKYQDVNTVDVDNRTPLYVACANGHEETVQLLLASGAHLHILTNDSCSPLHIACSRGHTEIVRLLLLGFTLVDFLDLEEWTPLFYACQSGQQEIVELLILNNADVNHRSTNGMTALHVATKYNRADIVHLLLTENAGVDAVDRDEKTALHYACENGNLDIVEVLLEKGADPSATTTLDLTPRQLAKQNQHTEIVNLLDSIKVGFMKKVLLVCSPGRKSSTKLKKAETKT